MTVNLEGKNDLWAPLSADGRYGPLDSLIVSYWGRREVDLAASYESPYRLHPVIVAAARLFAREDQACIEKGFPECVVAIFRHNGLSLWRVPQVDVFEWTKSYCRTNSPEEGPGSGTVVRYEEGPNGSAGIGLYKTGYSNEGIIDAWKIEELISRILPCWTRARIGGGGYLGVEGIFRANLLHYKFITADNDEAPKPAREVPQIEQPLPPEPLQAAVEEQPRESSRSGWCVIC